VQQISQDMEAGATLPLTLASARRARRLVRHAVAARVPDDALFTLELLTSEVVTNAVVHAESSPILRVVARGARVRVSVQDGSPRWPTCEHAADQALSGRGMALVDTLASEWGIERLPDEGKRVWFEVHP